MSDYQIAEKFWELKQTSGTNDRKQIFIEALEDENFLKACEFLYNGLPSGIGEKKLEKAISKCDTGFLHSISIEEIIDYLNDNNTGTDENSAYCATFYCSLLHLDQQEEIWDWFAKDFCTKKLKCGITKNTFDKLNGNNSNNSNISSASSRRSWIMRGKKFEDKYFNGDFLASIKLDGNRRVCLVEDDGNVSFFSRSGKQDFGLRQIEEDAKKLPLGRMYDGELLTTEKTFNNIQQRQLTASAANRKGNKKDLCFWIFDTVDLEDYKKGLSKEDAYERKSFMKDCQWLNEELEYVKFLETIDWEVNTKERIEEIAQEAWENSLEGLMLIRSDSLYECNPNPRNWLLKVKREEDFELEVESVNAGTGKFLGTMGSLTCWYKASDGNRYLVNVGTGFTDEERNLMNKDHNKIIGKKIEVSAQGESKNQNGGYSLSCPAFKRIVGDYERN